MKTREILIRVNNHTRHPVLSPLPRRGTVLIVVIWIVLVLASLVIVLSYFVRTEALASANYTSLAKAEAVAAGAIEYVLAMAADDETDSAVSYESNPYEAMQVGDGYFWVLQPSLSGDGTYEFGLTDEAGKINLNEASLEMLLKLPSMTSELANSIIDWRDQNEEVTVGGAENEYYLLAAEPYQCKNAPLETVEETLLIKGGSIDLLYGEDTNRNGMLDWNENDGETTAPDDNSNGKLDTGFFHYVTIHSYETNQPKNGPERINVSRNTNRGKLLELLTEEFGEEKALKIIAPLQLRPFSSLIEFYYFSGMDYDDFVKIADRLTTTDDEILSGRINVNAAPSEVLACLPQLEQKDVDDLIQWRSKHESDIDELGILWISKVLDREKATAVGPFLTAASGQYSADIIAVSADGRAYCRYYVVIDIADGSPKLVYKQSLPNSGWPLDAEILTTLRDGQEL